MKKLIKNKTIILAVAAILALAGFLYYQKSNKDAEITKSLETNVIPFIQSNNITFYFNADWCRAVKYESRAAVQVSDAAKSNSCLSNASSFSDDDEVIFNNIKDKLSEVKSEKFQEISIEYPLNRPEHAGLSHESIGLAFHAQCDFCRTRYVYWPDYSKLPPNIEGEIKYIPLDKNWYRIEQDWN